jgi:ketosteroid isomerase-like protein
MATNKEVVEGAYASFAQGDVPAALAAMDESIAWTEADGFPLAGTYIGPQAVLEGVFMRLGEVGDEFAVLPEQLIAEGDTVVALGTYTWKHKSTGAPAEVKMAHVWTVTDGKLAAFQQHVDTLKVRELS